MSEINAERVKKFLVDLEDDQDLYASHLEDADNAMDGWGLNAAERELILNGTSAELKAALDEDNLIVTIKTKSGGQTS